MVRSAGKVSCSSSSRLVGRKVSSGGRMGWDRMTLTGAGLSWLGFLLEVARVGTCA